MDSKLEKDIENFKKNYQTENKILTKEYLEVKRWELNHVIPSWMCGCDTYPTSAEKYEYLFKKDNKYLEVRKNFIKITISSTDKTVYSGRCNSKKFFEDLIKNLK